MPATASAIRTAQRVDRFTYAIRNIVAEAKKVEADGLLYPGGGAIGGGPLPEGVEARTNTVTVPKSSQMELVLVNPLTVILPEQP